MAISALKAHLQANFHPPAAIGIDAVFELAIADESLVFLVRGGELNFDLLEGTRPDATFRFDDVDTAWALLSGQANAFEAFMQGRFRADGYLTWAFALIAMFQNASLPASTIE
jgi:putative sterol carrier protein